MPDFQPDYDINKLSSNQLEAQTDGGDAQQGYPKFPQPWHGSAHIDEEKINLTLLLHSG